jgi:hypothetical protein
VKVVLQLERQEYLSGRAEMSVEGLAAEDRRRRATQHALIKVPHIHVS